MSPSMIGRDLWPKPPACKCLSQSQGRLATPLPASVLKLTRIHRGEKNKLDGDARSAPSRGRASAPIEKNGRVVSPKRPKSAAKPPLPANEAKSPSVLFDPLAPAHLIRRFPNLLLLRSCLWQSISTFPRSRFSLRAPAPLREISIPLSAPSSVSVPSVNFDSLLRYAPVARPGLHR